MFNKLFAKFFNRKPEKTAAPLSEPSSRFIDISSEKVNAVFGRECLPGEILRSTAATPESAEIQYCRA